MAIKRGYGDETWRLARAGASDALEQAASSLQLEHTDVVYESHRARAFALALRRGTAEALEELNAGWTEDWPTPDAYGLDIARIHLLAGAPARALVALGLDARSMGRSQMDDVVTLVLDCVASDRRLWRRGLQLALANSVGIERLLVPARILSASIRGDGRNPVAQPASGL